MTGARIRLAAVEHQTVDAIAGPLLTAEPLTGVGYAEPVEVIGPDGETRRGRVFEIDGDRVTVQVLDGTDGLDLAGTLVRWHGGTSRRAGALPLIVAAAVVLLGLAAGLLIWAPWRSPPLLRPAGLAAGPSTTGSVAFRWSRPATGPLPDRYVILHDGRVAGSVPGTVTSYQATGSPPRPRTGTRWRRSAAASARPRRPSSS